VKSVVVDLIHINGNLVSPGTQKLKSTGDEVSRIFAFLLDTSLVVKVAGEWVNKGLSASSFLKSTWIEWIILYWQ
jgi:hypothetical protein